jgi:hypothetical protein
MSIPQISRPQHVDERPPVSKEVRRSSPKIPPGSTTPSTHLTHGAGSWDGKSGGDGPNFDGPRNPPVSVGGQPTRRKGG